MADEADFDKGQHNRTHSAAKPAPTQGAEEVASTAENAVSPLSTSLLGDPRLNGRGNSPTRTALMQSAQRSHGNRALQRRLNQPLGSGLESSTQYAASSPATGAAGPSTSVQRHAGHDEKEDEIVQTKRSSGMGLALQRHPAGAGLSVDEHAAVEGITHPTTGGAISPAVGEEDGGAPPGGAPAGPTPAGPTPAGPTPTGPTPEGPTPTPAGPTPAGPTPAPTGPATAAPIPPESMSLARAQEVLTASYGTVHTIVQGKISIVDGRPALYAEYDRINLGRNNTYVTPNRAWQAGDAQQYIPGLEGFADTGSGTVYINKNSVLPTVTAHEMLHMNTAADFRGAVGETINEGTTEHLALKALTAAGVSTVGTGGAVAYPQQVSLTQKLIQVVTEPVLIRAYFGGSASLIQSYEALYGKGTWGVLKAFLEALDTAHAQPFLEPISSQTRINMCNALLDGWVSDTDLNTIESILTSSGGDRATVAAALVPRVKELWSSRQRNRLKAMLGVSD